MSEQPLVFVARANDGRVVDVLREDECVSDKPWNEMALWALLAIARDRKESFR